MPNILLISIASGKNMTGSRFIANNAQIEASGKARQNQLKKNPKNIVVRVHVPAHLRCTKECPSLGCLGSVLRALEEEIEKEMDKLGIKGQKFDRCEIIAHGNADGILSPVPGKGGLNQNLPEKSGLEALLKKLLKPKPITKGNPAVIIWACRVGVSVSPTPGEAPDVANSIAEELGQFVFAFSDIVDFFQQVEGEEGEAIPPDPKEEAEIVIYSPPVPALLLDELEMADIEAKKSAWKLQATQEVVEGLKRELNELVKAKGKKSDIKTYQDGIKKQEKEIEKQKADLAKKQSAIQKAQAKIDAFKKGLKKGVDALKKSIGLGDLGEGLKPLKTNTTQVVK